MRASAQDPRQRENKTAKDLPVPGHIDCSARLGKKVSKPTRPAMASGNKWQRFFSTRRAGKKHRRDNTHSFDAATNIPPTVIAPEAT